MKLTVASFTTFLIGAYTTAPFVDAGCPFSHLHNTEPNPHADNSHGVNMAAASQHSMKYHGTPLVQFRVPPVDRNPARTYVEGGMLMENEEHMAKTKKERRRKLQEPITGSSEADPSYSNQNQGDGGIPDGGYGAVRQAVIDQILTNSEGYWPADFDAPAGPNYGGLFIRLAWHCNGTYRQSDGRGGCDGGGIRFPPVSQWEDNGSLNMAIELLKPIKEQFGSKLSWGDLIVLAGEAAMNDMGLEKVGFCGGRIDWNNGDQEIPLGPSVIQGTLMPCESPDNDKEGLCPVGHVCPGCHSPLGAEAIGLIYVDPTGGGRDLAETAQNIREVFARMGFDDRMTVSAIGGGHAFGKSHGPCKKDTLINKCDAKWDQSNTAPGGASRSLEGDTVAECHSFCPDPDLKYVAGAGNPNITDSEDGPFSWTQKFTSGLEVTWTKNPTQWDNEYFRNLFDYEWVNITGPGGNMQWEPKNQTFPQMFTTDVALALGGDKVYEELSIEYRDSLENLTRDFQTSWYQLMSRDVGPRTRCLGDELPPIQPWEETMGPLVPLSTDKPDYVPIRAAIQKSIDEEPSNVAAFSTLAINCANTFRSTDYLGGCNGAAIRFPPSIDWESNKGTADYLKLLEPIKDEFPDITWSDLIVLAGQTSIETAGGIAMPYCGGRADSDNGDKSVGLEPKIFNNNTYDSIMYDIANKGMSLSEGVALMATPDPNLANLFGVGDDSTASLRQASLNDTTTGAYTLSNQFFVNLKATDEEWLTGDLADIAEQFINNNDYFLEQYSMAFNYLMTADLFNGPTKNACQGVSDPTLEGQTASPTATPVVTTDDAVQDVDGTEETPAGEGNTADDSAGSSSIVSGTAFFATFLAAASSWMMV